MELADAIAVMSSLAQSTRYRCVAHLLDRGEATAGDLAATLGVPANTMSAHLAILSHAGLVTFVRSGRHIIYTPRRDRLTDVIAMLSSLAHIGDRKTEG